MQCRISNDRGWRVVGGGGVLWGGGGGGVGGLGGCFGVFGVWVEWVGDFGGVLGVFCGGASTS